MEWLTRVDDRVTSVVPRVDQVVPSPSGALLAAFCTRRSDPDLVRRERVYIIEPSTGREVVALDGPEILRGFAWVGDDALLVLRDRDVGGATLRLHAIPDGGAVAELPLAELSAGPVAIELSADRSRALVAPWWMMSRRASDARVVVLPSLAPLARVGEGDVPDVAEAGTRPLWATLDPDGARTLVLWGDFEEGGYLSVFPTDLRARRPPPIRVERAGYYAAWWLSRDRVLLAARETFDPGALPCVVELDRGGVYSLPTPALHKEVIARALRPDLDGRRIAVLSQDAARDLHLSLVDLASLRGTDPRPWRHSLRFALALCWTSPGAIITACAERGRVHLARWSPDGGPAVDLTTVEHASSRSDFALSPVDHDTVTLSQPLDAGGFTVSLVNAHP